MIKKTYSMKWLLLFFILIVEIFYIEASYGNDKDLSTEYRFGLGFSVIKSTHTINEYNKNNSDIEENKDQGIGFLLDTMYITNHWVPQYGTEIFFSINISSGYIRWEDIQDDNYNSEKIGYSIPIITKLRLNGLGTWTSNNKMNPDNTRNFCCTLGGLIGLGLWIDIGLFSEYFKSLNPEASNEMSSGYYYGYLFGFGFYLSLPFKNVNNNYINKFIFEIGPNFMYYFNHDIKGENEQGLDWTEQFMLRIGLTYRFGRVYYSNKDRRNRIDELNELRYLFYNKCVIDNNKRILKIIDIEIKDNDGNFILTLQYQDTQEIIEIPYSECKDYKIVKCKEGLIIN